MAKKKRSLSLFFTVLFILLAVGGAIVYWFEWLSPSFIRYPAFGISLPANYPIHGIDVSNYQSAIDWDAVKDMQVEDVKLDFCFIKATEGLSYTDKRFNRNWRRAKRAGMHCGAYHYFNPALSGVLQAENFIDKVELEQNDLPPVLDIEVTNGMSKVALQQNVLDWLSIVEKHYGVRPIIYTNADFYENNLAGKCDEYPLWVAHYFAKQGPRIKRSWQFWQHSESGNVNGIKSKVDFNVFNGDSIAFKKMLIP